MMIPNLASFKIDGKNVWDLIIDKPAAKNPHEYYAFSRNDRFEGIISADGKWKLHLPHTYATLVKAGKNGAAGIYQKEQIELSLFDMQNDPYEKVNVITEFPQVATKLIEFAEQHKSKFYSDGTE